MSSSVALIQRYLRSLTSGIHDPSDICLLATEVKLIEDWMSSTRILAVVQKADLKQTAIFILTGSRISHDVYVDICASELLALDDQFRCEPVQSLSNFGSLDLLKITGRRLTKVNSSRFRLRTASSSAISGSVPSATQPESADSDEPNEPLRVIRLSEGESQCKPVHKRRATLKTFILGFSSSDQVTRFMEVIASCVPSRPQTVSTLDHGMVELGSDALHFDSACDDSWLRKYQKHIVNRKRQLSVPCLGTVVGDNTLMEGPNFRLDTDADSHSSSNLMSDSSASSLSVSPYFGQTTVVTGVQSAAASNARQSQLASFVGPPDRDFIVPLCESMNNGSSVGLPDAGSDLAERRCPEESLGSSRSYSDILTEPSGKSASIDCRKSLKFLEDHIFRSRLSHAELLVRQKLLEKEHEYCTVQTARIFIGTWNVNGRQDTKLNLDSWLLPAQNDLPADIYALGFQELDLSLGSVALNKALPAGLEEQWTAQIESACDGLLRHPSKKKPSHSQDQQTGGGFVRIGRVRLAGILLLVYISTKLFRHVSETDSQFLATGVFNMMGNKGAVGLRLTLFNTALCFVNCHLAAGEANLERRNQDFQEIKRRMIFQRRSSHGEPQPADQLSIQDHDIVFVFGDLNYRISSLSPAVVKTYIERKDYDRILGYDELLKQCMNHRTFGTFKESPITFAPTYKFDTNSNTYDTSEKNRTPSYCDRILWSGKLCEPVFYRSHSEFLLSDHKPVAGCFKVGLRRVNPNKFQRTYETVMRNQDLIYNLSLPQAQLDKQELDFGPVRFYEVHQRTFTLTNTGLTTIRYQFLRDGIAEFPPWLSISPESMNVETGASVQIDVEIFVKPEIVAQMNSGSLTLSAVTVLRLLGGKDYFVSITGQFVPTCFGLPLRLLLTLDDVPVAWIPSTDLQEKIRSFRATDCKEVEPSVLKSVSEPPAFHIPKEIFRMTDFIGQHLEEPELFRQSGQYDDTAVIRDMLDTTLPNVAFPESVSVHSVAFCLLIFLNSMADGVVPRQFQKELLNASQDFASAIKALSRLPVDHQNLFCYLTAFLRRCLAVSSKNGTDALMLANTFGDVVFRDVVTNAIPSNPRKVNRKGTTNTQSENTALFVHHFLANDPAIAINGMY